MPDSVDNKNAKIGSQLIGTHVAGGVTMTADNIFYHATKRNIPRRLTGLPSVQADEVIGRENDLERLTRELRTKSAVALVRGMGGVGKTTLATAYLRYRRQETDGPLAHVAWVTQTTDFATSLLAERGLLEATQVQLTDNPVADAQQLLRNLSNFAGPSLLVIDNAEADFDDFVPHLPGAPNWTVLVTARQRVKQLPLVELENLSEAAAVRLFRKHYTLTEDTELVNQIVRDVGRHALTVELLAKTAQAREIPLDRFYATIQEKGLQIGRRIDDVELSHDKDGQLKKLFPYLVATFDLSGLPEEEHLLLYQMTLLPAEFISTDLLARLLKIERDTEAWDELTITLRKLAGRGWLQKDAVQGWRLHRVIAEVVLLDPEQRFGTEVLASVLHGVRQYISFDEQSRVIPSRMVEELAFGEAVALRTSKATLPPETLSRFLDRLMILLKVFGRYREAAVHGDRALRLAKSHFGDEHSTVQVRRSNLAIVYRNLGRYDEAADLLETAMNYDIAHFGDEYPTVQTHRSNLANVYDDLGRYDEAAYLLETAMNYDIAHFGDDHPTVQIRRSNLAIVYRKLERYDEAANLLETAMNYDIAHFGDDHPTVQIRRSNLAIVYRKLGRYNEAAKLLETAMNYGIAHFGDDHPTVQTSRSNLASVYRALGRYDEAVKLLETAMNYDIERFGDDHPTVQIRRSNLARVYWSQGRQEKAYALITLAEQNLSAKLGTQHPNVQAIKNMKEQMEETLGKA